MHKIKTCQFINVLDYRFWAVAALLKKIITYWNHPLKVSTSWWITKLLKILNNDFERPLLTRIENIMYWLNDIIYYIRPFVLNVYSCYPC